MEKRKLGSESLPSGFFDSQVSNERKEEIDKEFQLFQASIADDLIKAKEEEELIEKNTLLAAKIEEETKRKELCTLLEKLKKQKESVTRTSLDSVDFSETVDSSDSENYDDFEDWRSKNV